MNVAEAFTRHHPPPDVGGWVTLLGLAAGLALLAIGAALLARPGR